MVVVVMGVSGSGKSGLGQALAEAMGWDFLEGDDMHPRSNIEKMRAGIALDDGDRIPWLDHIATWIGDEDIRGRQSVVACSALKHAYREQLRQAGEAVRFIYLRVGRSELEHRLRKRHHFMPASLLDSQLQTLEEPSDDEAALTLPEGRTTDEMIAEVRHWLQQGGSPPTS